MSAQHEGPCCANCTPGYLTRELGREVCCCESLAVDLDDAEVVDVVVKLMKQPDPGEAQ